MVLHPISEGLTKRISKVFSSLLVLYILFFSVLSPEKANDFFCSSCLTLNNKYNTDEPQDLKAKNTDNTEAMVSGLTKIILLFPAYKKSVQFINLFLR